MLPTSRLLSRPIRRLRQTSIISSIVLDPEHNKSQPIGGSYLRRYESSHATPKLRAIGFREPEKPWTKHDQNVGVINLPNILTMSRLALTPVASYLIISGMHTQAVACVGVAALADIANKIALKYTKINKASKTNYALESIADFAFVTTCTVVLFNLDMIRVWLFKGMMLRQCVVFFGFTTLRYFSFGQDKVTMREFLDFETRPTIGLDPPISSKLFHSMFYVMMIAELASDPVVANRLYNGWAVWGAEVLTLIPACQTLTYYMKRFIIEDFFVSRLTRK